MKAQTTPQTANWHNDSSLVEQGQAAVTLLEQVLAQQANLRSQEVDWVEQAVVRLRNSLIDQLRQKDGSAADSKRTALTRVNMALSLIVGVEYPAAGVQQQLLEQAYTVLRDLLAEGLLDGETKKKRKIENK